MLLNIFDWNSLLDEAFLLGFGKSVSSLLVTVEYSNIFQGNISAGERSNTKMSLIVFFGNQMSSEALCLNIVYKVTVDDNGCAKIFSGY